MITLLLGNEAEWGRCWHVKRAGGGVFPKYFYKIKPIPISKLCPLDMLGIITCYITCSNKLDTN